MAELKRFVVPVQLIARGEDAHDAMVYVLDALEQSSLLEEDGMVAYDDDIDVDDIFEQEE